MNPSASGGRDSPSFLSSSVASAQALDLYGGGQWSPSLQHHHHQQQLNVWNTRGSVDSSDGEPPPFSSRVGPPHDFAFPAWNSGNGGVLPLLSSPARAAPRALDILCCLGGVVAGVPAAALLKDATAASLVDAATSLKDAQDASHVATSAATTDTLEALISSLRMDDVALFRSWAPNSASAARRITSAEVSLWRSRFAAKARSWPASWAPPAHALAGSAPLASSRQAGDKRARHADAGQLEAWGSAFCAPRQPAQPLGVSGEGALTFPAVPAAGAGFAWGGSSGGSLHSLGPLLASTWGGPAPWPQSMGSELLASPAPPASSQHAPMAAPSHAHGGSSRASATRSLRTRPLILLPPLQPSPAGEAVPTGAPPPPPVIILVNEQQHAVILRRRAAHAEMSTRILSRSTEYLWESRHSHAMRRPRHASGRFLTKQETEEREQRGLQEHDLGVFEL